MDGTVTEGRKGIAYLRDHYLPAIVADAVDQGPRAEDRAVRAAVAPAPV